MSGLAELVADYRAVELAPTRHCAQMDALYEKYGVSPLSNAYVLHREIGTLIDARLAATGATP